MHVFLAQAADEVVAELWTDEVPDVSLGTDRACAGIIPYMAYHQNLFWRRHNMRPIFRLSLLPAREPSKQVGGVFKWIWVAVCIEVACGDDLNHCVIDEIHTFGSFRFVLSL